MQTNLKQLNEERLKTVRESIRKQQEFFELAKLMSTALDKIDTSKFTELSNAVNKLQDQLKTLPKALTDATKANTHDLQDSIDKVSTALASIEVNPQVDVKVPKIDLKPLQEALSAKAPESPTQELYKFKAQDIDDDNPGFQYVGMVNADGIWCFIENDLQSNSLRYKLGSSDYGKAWENHIQFDYKRWDEAVNEISA